VTKEKSSNKEKEDDSPDGSDALKIEHSSLSTHKGTLDEGTPVECEPTVEPDSEIDDGGPLSI